MKIDIIYRNGDIRTLEPDRPRARALGVLNGRIVGFDEELDGVEAAEHVDLGGAVTVPGFHDAHFHASPVGRRLASLDLRPDAIGDLDALYAVVARRAASLGPDEWVRGAGYDQNALGAHPTAEALDRAANGRPVLLEHVSGHMVVANTRAFELAGYPGRRDVPETPGGHVERDADGLPTGLLQETAKNFIFDAVRPLPEDEVLGNLALTSELAMRYGLTSVTEPGLCDPLMIGNSPIDFGIYQTAVERGVLRMRMTVAPYFTTLHEIEGLRDAVYRGVDFGIRTGFGDERLRIGPVKILTDGSFIGRSAAMHRCYHGEPDNTGIMLQQGEELPEFVIGAHKAGWQVAAHAIGDAAVDAALDAFEEAQRRYPRADMRHRIEHFALASDSQIERAARLGVVAVPQAVFVADFGDAMAEAMGDERADLIYRMKSLLDAGMVLPGSTDAPVSDANPITCIHHMVNRRTASGRVLNPAEALTVDEAVRAYTHGSAYAVHEEGDKGTLRRGKLADFVTLSDDLWATAPDRIREVTVTRTVVGGRTEFEA